jgi:hypothetical protein
VTAVAAQGLVVERSTYAFHGTFPMFAAERLSRRLKERVGAGSAELAPGEVPPLPRVHPAVRRMLLWLCGLDRRLLPGHDLPFGSSVLVVATKR